MDWQALEQSTNDLVTQDFLNFPRVQRDLLQLQQAAEQARARTSRIRSLPNAIAAARLLAQQGVDAGRLTQDVTSLELQPTVADLYAAEPATIDEYLRQLEEAAVLTALHEAQADTVASFDAFMDACTARDWAADKARMFAAPPAPAPAGSGLGLGAGGGAADGGAATGPRLSPKEAAYVAVVKRLMAASASGAKFNAVAEFSAACTAHEEAAGPGDSTIGTCWALLRDIMAAAEAQNVGPSSRGRCAIASLERAHTCAAPLQLRSAAPGALALLSVRCSPA
jgi:nuclear pore complex protein Nup93